MFGPTARVTDRLTLTHDRWKLRSRGLNKLKYNWNIELGVNTELVLECPKANQIVLKHWKKPKEVWSPTHSTPPPSGEHDQRFNEFFPDPFPEQVCITVHCPISPLRARELTFLQKVHLPLTCHVSCVICHVSHVTCHVSHATCNFFFQDKVMKLASGGSVINGVYPV